MDEGIVKSKNKEEGIGVVFFSSVGGKNINNCTELSMKILRGELSREETTADAIIQDMIKGALRNQLVTYRTGMMAYWAEMSKK